MINKNRMPYSDFSSFRPSRQLSRAPEKPKGGFLSDLARWGRRAVGALALLGAAGGAANAAEATQAEPTKLERAGDSSRDQIAGVLDFRSVQLEKGQTLSDIAKQEGVSLTEIYRLNPSFKGNENRLAIDTKVVLPAKSRATEIAAEPAPASPIPGHKPAAPAATSTGLKDFKLISIPAADSVRAESATSQPLNEAAALDSARAFFADFRTQLAAGLDLDGKPGRITPADVLQVLYAENLPQSTIAKIEAEFKKSFGGSVISRKGGIDTANANLNKPIALDSDAAWIGKVAAILNAPVESRQAEPSRVAFNGTGVQLQQPVAGGTLSFTANAKTSMPSQQGNGLILPGKISSFGENYVAGTIRDPNRGAKEGLLGGADFELGLRMANTEVAAQLGYYENLGNTLTLQLKHIYDSGLGAAAMEVEIAPELWSAFFENRNQLATLFTDLPADQLSGFQRVLSRLELVLAGGIESRRIEDSVTVPTQPAAIQLETKQDIQAFALAATLAYAVNEKAAPDILKSLAISVRHAQVEAGRQTTLGDENTLFTIGRDATRADQLALGVRLDFGAFELNPELGLTRVTVKGKDGRNIRTVSPHAAATAAYNWESGDSTKLSGSADEHSWSVRAAQSLDFAFDMVGLDVRGVDAWGGYSSYRRGEFGIRYSDTFGGSSAARGRTNSATSRFADRTSGPDNLLDKTLPVDPYTLDDSRLGSEIRAAKALTAEAFAAQENAFNKNPFEKTEKQKAQLPNLIFNDETNQFECADTDKDAFDACQNLEIVFGENLDESQRQKLSLATKILGAQTMWVRVAPMGDKNSPDSKAASEWKKFSATIDPANPVEEAKLEEIQVNPDGSLDIAGMDPAKLEVAVIPPAQANRQAMRAAAAAEPQYRPYDPNEEFPVGAIVLIRLKAEVDATGKIIRAASEPARIEIKDLVAATLSAPEIGVEVINEENVKAVPLSFELKDNDPRAKIKVKISFDGKSYFSLGEFDQGKVSTTFDAAKIPGFNQGRLELVIIATDAAGIDSEPQRAAIEADTVAPRAQLVLDLLAGDDILNLAESKLPVAITGKATGEFKTGDIVQVMVGEKKFTGTVTAGGAFSVEVPGADLVAAGGKVKTELTIKDPAGNTVKVPVEKTVSIDLQSAGSVALDAVTADSIITAAEAAGPVELTGSAGGDAKAGDTVKISISDQVFEAKLDENLKFKLSVPGSVLAANTSGEIKSELVGADAAGNTFTAVDTEKYSVDLVAAGELSLKEIAVDGVINIAESRGEVAISGEASGDAKPGDTVQILVNGKTLSGVLDAARRFSIAVPGAELVADADRAFEVTMPVKDEVGNTATVRSAGKYSVDLTRPALTGSFDKQQINAGETATLTITLPAGVSDLDELDFAVTGGTLSGFKLQGQTATASFTPVENFEGAGTVSIKAGGIRNIAGNTNELFEVARVAVDTKIPEITGSFDKPQLKIGETTKLTLQLSAGATGLDAGDFEVVGGTLSGFKINGQTAEIIFTPKENFEGTGTVSIKAGAIQDAAKNPNKAAQIASIAIDTKAPELSGSFDKQQVNASQTATLKVAIPTGVTGLEADDFTATGGTLSELNIVNGEATMRFTPQADFNGAGKITLKASAVQDSFKNPNAETEIASIVVRTKLPVATGSFDKSALKIGESAELTITLPADATDLTIDDLAVARGTLSNFTKTGAVAKVTFTPQNGFTGSGSVTMKAGAIKDAAGNLSKEATLASISIDTEGPAPTISLSANITEDDLINIAESGGSVSITGTVGGDAKSGDTVTLRINNQNFTGLVASDRTFSIAVPGSALVADSDRKIEASITSSDAAGNTANATDDESYSVDLTRPTLSATSNVSALKIGETATITATIPSGVTGLTGADFSATHGTLSGFSQTGNTATLTFTPAANTESTAVISLNANAVTNAAGNPNTAADLVSISIDTVAPAPTISIATLAGDDVISLAEQTGNITLSGTAGGDAKQGDTVTATVNGQNYTTTLNASRQYSFTNIPASQFVADSDRRVQVSVATTDPAGNPGEDEAELTYTVETADLEAPTIGSVSSSASLINALNVTAVPISVTGLADNVAGNLNLEYRLNNGSWISAGSFAQGNRSFTVDVSGVADGNVTIDVRAVDPDGEPGHDTSDVETVTIEKYTTVANLDSVPTPSVSTGANRSIEIEFSGELADISGATFSAACDGANCGFADPNTVVPFVSATLSSDKKKATVVLDFSNGDLSGATVLLTATGLTGRNGQAPTGITGGRIATISVN